MRTTRIALALALIVSPAIASAQTPGNCAATTPAGLNPTCSLTRSATATISSILLLGIKDSAAISLQASDTAAYEKTRLAGGTTGVTPTVTTKSALQSASAADTLTVYANRPYALTISATTDIFTFDRDGNYATCRKSATATVNCGPATGANGKPVGDLYWMGGDNASYTSLVGPASPATLRTGTTGERYKTGVAFKSAWFYDTDIPGSYTATIRYTLTGN